MIDTVLFDLDGTLSDPKIGITKSVQYSLKKYNIEIDDLSELEKFIGPPLKESYIKYFSFSESESIAAIDYYREYFSEQGMYENTLYPGIADLLQSLKDKGVTIALATSKPTFFAEKILQHFEIDQFFTEIVGSNMDNTRTDKRSIIDYALGKLNKSHSSSIMIGDRKHDLIGARSNSVGTIGVLYGYGSEEEIAKENPDYIVGTVSELETTLQGIIAL